MVGIYCIYSKSQNKYYIGESIDIKKRWWKHLSDLRLGKHHSKYLQNTYNKYGEDDLVFNVIEECSLEDRFDKEINYIKQYDSFKDGFNETLGGERGCPGRAFSQETLEKMSERIRGELNPQYNKWGDLNPNSKLSKEIATYIYFYTHSNFSFPVLRDKDFYGHYSITKDSFGKIKRDVTWEKLKEEIDLNDKELYEKTLNFIKSILSEAL